MTGKTALIKHVSRVGYYVSRQSERRDGLSEYLGEDGTWHGTMVKGCGTYFKSIEDAERALSRATPDAPVMTLPDGTILREGDYAKLRNGEVVPVYEYRKERLSEYFVANKWHYSLSGKHGYEGNPRDNARRPDLDIIAKAPSPRLTAAVAQLDAEEGADTMTTVFGYTLRELHDIVAEHERRIAPPKPVRETVTLTGGAYYRWEFSPLDGDHDTHKITFDLIDGHPDPASIHLHEVTE